MQRNTPTAFSLLAVALLLAGCLAAPATEKPAAVAPPPAASSPTAPLPTAPPDVNATTESAPTLAKGEWWRIRFESGLFTGTPELTRVVAAVEPDGYVVGMPHEGWVKEALAFHAPSFGDVGKDLSFDVHNERFEPLRFPLTKGESWRTRFGADEYTATVESADRYTATIRYDPPQADPKPTDPAFAALMLLSPLAADGQMRMTYDAREHEVVKFESSVGSWEVVAHGYGFTGWTTVPRGEHVAIDYGQFGPATPGGPVLSRQVAVPNGFDRMTLLQAVVPLAPGAYEVRDVSPNGTEFATRSVAGRDLVIGFYEASAPGGTWTLQDVVAGAGATYTMGMVYHQYDIRLPDGAVRMDHAHPVAR